MTKHFHLGQYVRHDRNVWYSPCGVCIADKQTIARLEAEYRAHQRQQSSGLYQVTQPTRRDMTPRIERKGQHKTDRESETRNGKV